jgi:hypothetical protein
MEGRKMKNCLKGQKYKYIERQKDRKTERQRDRETERHIKGKTERCKNSADCLLLMLVGA